MSAPARKEKPPRNNELNDLFAELKTEYLESFAEKIQVIEQMWQAKDRESLTNEYHKIKGTGLTYGVQEMTDIAEIVEDLCHQKSPQLGFAIMMSVELFKRVRASYEQGESFELGRDKIFKALRKIQEELETA